jgi:CheY-like chemotaxis protein
MYAAIKLAYQNGSLKVMMNHGRIFYVDDNPKSRRLLTSVIKSCGFDVTSAGDPIEALSRIRKCPFDLALLDYQMPHLTGSQLAQKIKSSRPDVPVVLISGFSALPPFELIFVDAHVGRGATLDELLDTMRSLIHSRCAVLARDLMPLPNGNSIADGAARFL